MNKEKFKALNTIILQGDLQEYLNARALCGHLSTTSFANAIECYLLTGNKAIYDEVKKDFLVDLHDQTIKNSIDEKKSHMTAIRWALKSTCIPNHLFYHHKYFVTVETQFEILHDVYRMIEENHASFENTPMQSFQDGIIQYFAEMLDDPDLGIRYHAYRQWLEHIASSYQAYQASPKAIKNHVFALNTSISSLSLK